MLLVPNHHVIVPKTIDLSVQMAKIVSVPARNATTLDVVAVNDTIIELPVKPISSYLVELYLDGVRIVNPKYPTTNTMGIPFECYNIIGTQVIFNEPITGTLHIIIDNASAIPTGALTILVDNFHSVDTYIQRFNPARWAPGILPRAVIPVTASTPRVASGTASVNALGYVNTELRVAIGDSLYAEPLVLSQPSHGYAVLSNNRKNLVYVPNSGYVGFDTFGYTLMSQHGQIGMPKCVSVEIR